MADQYAESIIRLESAVERAIMRAEADGLTVEEIKAEITRILKTLE